MKLKVFEHRVEWLISISARRVEEKKKNCPIDQVENEELESMPCHVSHVTICYLVLWLFDMLEWLRECSFVFDVIIQLHNMSSITKPNGNHATSPCIYMLLSSCHPNLAIRYWLILHFSLVCCLLACLGSKWNLFSPLASFSRFRTLVVTECKQKAVQAAQYAAWCDEQPEKLRARREHITNLHDAWSKNQFQFSR